ncbi:MAG TPA: hypothetical protein VMB34_23565 [Acetobacteraceae bacterium]|nr:hypothetical protein [Acetobacteraceae bacterium]
MTVDEAYSYLAPAQFVGGLTGMNDPKAAAVRYAGTMPNGTRIWWVNLKNAALDNGADRDHPLECRKVSEKLYTCQWIPSANDTERSNYWQMLANNISDFPSFFYVVKASVDWYAGLAALTQTHEEALAAGQAISSVTSDWYYKDANYPGGNEELAECQKLSGTPKQFADAAVGRGAAGLEITGNDISGADAVITFDLQNKKESYLFYNSHGKCSNPLDAPDYTESDFSTIHHPVNTDQGKIDKARSDEVLRRAKDKGPWWVSDGTKLWEGCKPSKLTPMGDAQSAKANGARDIEIDWGLNAGDVVVEYEFNGRPFYNDYHTNKFCGGIDPPSQGDRERAIGIAARSGKSWYVDYYSDQMQCVETKRPPIDLADRVKGRNAVDIAFAVPAHTADNAFLYLEYGIGDQGHIIGFYKTHDACAGEIRN